ncbi:MAG TPA: hypothetical protein VJ788_03030 [Gemmatimonadota bacterium]|nr:hypothetical protein [Gemmatimonadota bacterium]
MKTSILISLAALAWTAIGSEPVAAQTLRYGAEAGTTHTYVRTQRDHVTQTINGAEQTADVNSYWRFDATMNDSEGGRSVEIVHDSLSIQSTPQADSDFSALYGQPVTVMMDERGAVTEVLLPDSIPPAAARLDLGMTYRGFYPVLPAEPVSEGGGWTDTMNLRTNQNGLDMTIQRINHYTARGNAQYAGHTALQVDFTSEVAIEGSGSQQGADISLSGTGTGNGSFYFLADPGVYLGGTETGEMKMDAFVVAGGQNLVIPIVQQREETIELVD